MNHKPVGTLLSDLAHEATDLVRSEVALARSEISDKVSQVGTGMESLVTSGVVLLGGFLVLLWALVLVFAEIIAPWTTQAWVAPLIVGAVLALIGYLMLRSATKRLRPANLVPERTTRSLRRDKEEIGGHLK